MPRIPRTTPRVGADDIFRQAQSYLALRADKLDAEKKFKAIAARVKKWLDSGGTLDAEGNKVFKFDREVQGIDGKVYAGVRLRRDQGPQYFDSDEVIAFAKSFPRATGITARLIKMVETPVVDELYVLQQEGKITEKQLRSLMHDPEPSYSLWPVEAGAVTEEDD